jgi:hypothetical protein
MDINQLRELLLKLEFLGGRLLSTGLHGDQTSNTK